MKKPINVYWAPSFELGDNVDWTFLYPAPEVLFKNLMKNKKNEKGNSSLFACPAVSNKFKKMLVFSNSLDCSYDYDSKRDPEIIPQTEQYLSLFRAREDNMTSGPIYKTNLSYIFFSDEPVNVSFTPPYFHKPGFTKSASVIPGEFDVGQWFRSYVFEFQTWSDKVELVLEVGEPLFYAEFKTDRPIVLHRFSFTDTLEKYSNSMVDSTRLFGRGQSLQSRYERARSVGFREKILTEIKNNLVGNQEIQF
jgi:hypothetical protein